jgi:hypothetical protein
MILFSPGRFCYISLGLIEIDDSYFAGVLDEQIVVSKIAMLDPCAVNRLQSSQKCISATLFNTFLQWQMKESHTAEQM